MLEKLIIYAIIAIVAFGLITGLYLGWENNVKQKALNEYNQQQIEQTIKDQEKFKEQLDNVSKNQIVIKEKLDIQNKELEAKFKSIDEYLNSDEAKKDDRDSSPVLKNTIQKLKELNSK